MRAFIARNIGTNTWVTEPIDPYVSIDTGETIDTRTFYDAKRPDCVLVGECKTTLVSWKNAERWVCVTSANVAPAGTYDVGDPSAPAFMDSLPSNPERNAIASFLGVASQELSGVTWRQLMADALAHTAAWRALFSDGQSVDLIGGG